ncbi:MAG: LCP family protein [Tissierellia bacterium]|nr:LCP family protein [Tissierellia bacterium]
MKKKYIPLIIVVAIIVMVGFAGYFFKDTLYKSLATWGSVSGQITAITTDQPQHHSTKPVNETTDDLAPDDLVFLAMGIDTKESEDQLGVRTDTLMLFRVSFANKSIKILSIPRDSRVPVKGRLDKINHAHSYGGIELSLKTVQDFLNLPIEYYARLDYKAVAQVVDSIGGIDLDIKGRMYYKDPSLKGGFTIDFQPGEQRISGEQSILFLRYRSYPRGDVDRVENQQYFIRELIKQAKERVSVGSIPGMVSAAISYTDTNISIARIIRGLELMKNFDKVEIETKTLPGVGQTIGDASYYIVDEPAAKEVINEWFGDMIKK